MKKTFQTVVSLLLCSLLVLPATAATTAGAESKLDINTATAGELTELPRIGPAVAARIVAYREQNGGFRTVEELMQVRGIGEKTFERLRERVTIARDGEPGAEASAESPGAEPSSAPGAEPGVVPGEETGRTDT